MLAVLRHKKKTAQCKRPKKNSYHYISTARLAGQLERIDY